MSKMYNFAVKKDDEKDRGFFFPRVLDAKWKVPLMSESALEKLSSIYTIHSR